MDIKEIAFVDVDCIHLPEGKVMWWALVNTILKRGFNKR
jgi:hypothetical protein